MKKECPYDKVCAYCEYAGAENEDDNVYCKKRKKEFPAAYHCRAFTYDLLKRVPQQLKSPRFEDLPIL